MVQFSSAERQWRLRGGRSLMLTGKSIADETFMPGAGFDQLSGVCCSLVLSAIVMAPPTGS